MQLVALNEENRLVLAKEASKGKDYFCPECRKAVRLRAGPSRRPHFFHKFPRKKCRQFKKSWNHLKLQLHILNLLPKGEATLEKPFPEIKRVADVIWETQGIVFEVQCSPIDLSECQERIADYQSLGLTTVWILHDFKFNRRNLSAAEKNLRKTLCFFSTIDRFGHCHIYDQFEIIKDTKRLYRSRRLPTDIARPIRSSGHLTFQGSLPHRIAQNPSLSAHIQAKEQLYNPSALKPPPFFKIRKKYIAFLEALLKILAKPTP